MRNRSGKDIFKPICLKSFEFLEEEFGCKPVSVKREFYGTFIVYKNTTTAIRVSIEPYDGGIFVFLIRLVRGEIPEYPSSIEATTSLFWFDLEDLIALRAPSLKLDRPPLDDLFKPSNLEKILAQYAQALRKYAIDILRGDFSVFNELSKIVKERA